MTTKSKVPQIRFKGFDESWKEKGLNQIVDVCSGRDYKHLESGNIPVYGTGGYMLSVNKALSYDKNAIGIGRKGTIDKPYILKAPFWTVDTLFYAVPIQDNYLPFVYSIFQRINWKQKDESTGVPSLSKIAINNIQVFSSKETEQIKIGDYFQQLDKLIEQKERKYQKLKQFKKAMLDKMFPKNGADTPEIRFKGFSEKWKILKFKELANVKRGLTYKPSDINSYGIKVLRSSNIDEDKFVQNEDDVYVREEAINIDFINKFDILITSANGSSRLVGKHAIIQNLNSKAVHGGFMLLATSKSPFFLNASMSSSWYKEFINKFVSGGNGAIGNLSKSDLDEQEIYAPEIEEQEKIGNYFQKLDNQIDLQQKELEKLKNIKKASLSKMFV